MAVRGSIACALLVAACGRIGFAGGDDVLDVDGATGDSASGDTGPALDCTMTYPTAKLCSGFEGSGMAPWDYDILEQGTVALSTAQAYRGAQSLEIQTLGADLYKYARWGKNSVLNAVDSGDIYLRTYYWIDPATQVTDQLSIMVVGNGNDPFPSTNVRIDPGKLVVVVDGNSTSAPFDFPRGRWTCMVLHLKLAATGSVEVSVDGASVVSRTGLETRVAGGYTNVDVGVHYATPTQAAAHLWIDEVVLDTAPVTCN